MDNLLVPGVCTTGCTNGCGCTQDSDCGEEQTCQAGQCQGFLCPAQPLDCAAGCTSESVPHTCGACVCTSCPTPVDGGSACDPTTCTGQGGVCCNGLCTDTSWDSMNCGTCGNVCGPDEACVANNGGPGGAPADCEPATCALDAGNCCGRMTCGATQACCNATGDVVPYPPFTCVDLSAGECPPQCFCA